ncbi:13701_t:CDS:2 [Gigaspora margarita]|uniref:13701_t:CDS:1 n=1 Tax=Gigaspora margarita TaxID=4874 RepID=A0ABN7VL48_GIGMA|nr:13701_t:CDS:2 [Gigaspora margarita]
MKITDEETKQITNLCKEVSIATGVDEATIACVVAEFNKNRNIISSEQDHQSSKDFQVEYVNAVHDLILFANRNDKARNYWKMVDNGINNESEDEDIDLYSEDENPNKEV